MLVAKKMAKFYDLSKYVEKNYIKRSKLIIFSIYSNFIFLIGVSL